MYRLAGVSLSTNVVVPRDSISVSVAQYSRGKGRRGDGTDDGKGDKWMDGWEIGLHGVSRWQGKRILWWTSAAVFRLCSAMAVRIQSEDDMKNKVEEGVPSLAR
jgi:hypothetical protein